MLFDADRWTEIWVTITRNKTRSLLTCFGVFWGILMLVILLGLGTGLKNGILKNTDGFATNSVFFIADRTSEPYRGFNKGREWNIRNRDLESIRREVSGLEAISPVLWGARADKNVKGVDPAYFRIEAQHVLFGRLLNEIDAREKRKVCLIGSRINETLFRNENPCGRYIRVNGIYYQVVGVVRERARVNIGGRSQESVFLPFTTMQQTLNQGDVIHFLAASAYKDVSIQRIIDDITGILRRQNSIAPTDKQAVMVINIAEQFATFAMLFTGIDALIWLVGMGTLLAGVIGISNIMMVTVKERTREIGVRRAIGARPRDIISQIMSESLVLTAMAGMIGLSIGVFIIDIVDRLLSAQPGDDAALVNPGVHMGTALAATFVLLVCGLLAGLIPAWRAMQIKAIDAIRDE